MLKRRLNKCYLHLYNSKEHAFWQYDFRIALLGYELQICFKPINAKRYFAWVIDDVVRYKHICGNPSAN